MKYRIVPAVAIIIAACTAPDSGPTLGPVERDSAGVHIIEYHSNALDSAPLIQLSHHIVEIGAIEGASYEMLSGVQSGFITASSDIVFADVGADEIRSFSAAGEHQWTSGRSGEGPGEYAVIQWIQQWGDSIVVFDRSLDRLSYLSTDGAFQGSVSLATQNEAGNTTAVGILRDGGIVTTTTQWATVGDATPGVNPKEKEVGVYRPETGLVSVMDVDGPRWFWDQELQMLATQMFTRDDAVVLADGELVVARSGGFQFDVFGTDGSYRRSVRFAKRRQAVTRNHIDDFLQGTIEAIESRQGDAEEVQFARTRSANMEYPDSFPTFSSLHRYSDGTIGATLYRTDSEQPLVLVFFDQALRPMGRVHLDGETILDRLDSLVLTVRRDDLGVQYVRLYRIGA